MKSSRVAAMLTLPAAALFAFVATPIRVYANDVPTSFGFKAAVEGSHFAQPAISDDRHEVAIGPRSMGTSHENHLGGDLAGRCDDWNMHEGEGSWRNHDDDGGDDDHDGGKTSVPEPSSALMLASGLSALAGWRLRRRA